MSDIMAGSIFFVVSVSGICVVIVHFYFSTKKELDLIKQAGSQRLAIIEAVGALCIADAKQGNFNWTHWDDFDAVTFHQHVKALRQGRDPLYLYPSSVRERLNTTRANKQVA